MKPIIDINECLRDSPQFRLLLNENECDIDLLEAKLEKLVKLSNGFIELGRNFIRSKSALIGGISDLVGYFGDDTIVVNCLNRLTQSLAELMKYDSILIDQANRTIGKNLSEFIKYDISEVKDTKKHFDKISDDFDVALIRNSQASKWKPAESEEAANLLIATRSCFQHTAFDYISQLSCLQYKKRHEILDSVLSFMRAYGTHFHQGSDLFQDLDPFMKQTANLLVKLREETEQLRRQLERKHSVVSGIDVISTRTKGDEAKLEGYLFKRSSNAFKTWKRRWFKIQNNQLVYQKRTNENEPTKMEEDLRLCNVKHLPDLDRKHCFEIVSPTKSHILQADSEDACKQWILSIEAGIDAAYNDVRHDQEEGTSLGSQESLSSSSNSTSKSANLNAAENSSSSSPAKPPRAHNQILNVTGNDVCCDCKAQQPKWASLNLGVTLCIECSGIHRSLGVHISKVKSLTLDAWEQESIKVMLALGNNIVNSIYEENLSANDERKINADSNRSEREVFIKHKYVSKSFVSKKQVVQSDTAAKVNNCDSEQGANESTLQPPCNGDYYNAMLFKAAQERDLQMISEALSQNAQVNWRNEKELGRYPLHESVLSNSVTASEFLLLNGAKCNYQDDHGRTPLHIAVERGNTGQVCQLLKRGADQGLLDKDGKDALRIGVDNANADIVTLLRLAKLNEEMKKECGNPTDEIFNDVVRDFSHMATNSPEKLRRNL